MSIKPRVDVWYSLQSDYCYFLLDRLIWLSQRDVDIVIRPVLGIVLRMPEATKDRGEIEQRYFQTDTERTAAYLQLPYVYPDPSPTQFAPGSGWIAAQEQPLIERLYRLFVGATRAGKGLEFLDQIGRGLWNGANPNWNQGDFLPDGMARIGLQQDQVLESATWQDVTRALQDNHNAMLELGHWGVPLMAFHGEPFYGQDRFDQLIWRMGVNAE